MSVPRKFTLRPVAFGAALATGAALLAGSAAAQTAALGKSVFAEKAFCARCHGWAGDGNPEDDRAPRGSNLRATALTVEQIREVILCGRPTTGMPYFDRKAWSADLQCYGMTAAEIGTAIPPPAATTLIQREIDSVLLYLQEAIIGKDKPSREQCLAYWGTGAGGCAKYPTAAELKAAAPATPTAAPTAAARPRAAAPAAAVSPH